MKSPSGSVLWKKISQTKRANLHGFNSDKCSTSKKIRFETKQSGYVSINYILKTLFMHMFGILTVYHKRFINSSIFFFFYFRKLPISL
jgi:hypothetical protein